MAKNINMSTFNLQFNQMCGKIVFISINLNKNLRLFIFEINIHPMVADEESIEEPK